MSMQVPTTSGITLSAHEAALFNDLLQLNLDGQSGYETAANALSNQDYAELFRQFARERQENAAESTQLLQANGHSADKAGTLSGLFHQGRLNVESLLTKGDAPLFAECERADALALAAYQDVMGQTTREELMEILRRQFTVIRDAHDRVKVLRSALEQAQK